jgi:superfamily II DNA or RNA helicase
VYIGDIIANMDDFAKDSSETGAKKFDKVISYDTSRNELVVKDILEQVFLKRKILVLSERKEHLKILELYLKGQCETLVFTGDDSTASRTSKQKQIHDGHYQVLLATGQIFGEGISIPNIEALIFAFPFAFEGKVTQYVGRLVHSYSPKVLIDYHDRQIPFLDRQFKQRDRQYKKLGNNYVKNY